MVSSFREEGEIRTVLTMPIRPENKHRYPSSWKEVVKRIKERADNKCEWCGAENHAPHPVTGAKVILTIAHLDHTPENCNDENLKALCQQCHNSYDTKERARGIRLRRMRAMNIEFLF
jgi:5-methylcytosine-specific restriction endonuclease McrA